MLMLEHAEPVRRLIDELKRLPGIGQKSAQRIAFHLMRVAAADVENLVTAIRDVREKVRYCSVCNNLTDIDPCRVCASTTRDRSQICVVEDPSGLVSIERTGHYDGLYHVLHGTLSPIQGIGPDELRIKNLFERLHANEVREIILATSPTTEGEATANYLGRLMKPLGLRVTRLAMGLPVGTDLENADQVTVDQALTHRREF